MKITQSKIQQIFLVGLILFLALIAFRLFFFFFFPPVLTKSYLEKKQSPDTIVIEGFGFGKTNDSSILYFNGKAIPHRDIFYWKDRKIIFHIEEPLKSVNIVSFSARKLESNENFLVYNSTNSNIETPFLFGDSELFDEEIPAPLLKNSTLRLGAPLEFSGFSDTILENAIYDYEVRYQDKSYSIPKYLIEKKNGVLSIYFPEYFWWDAQTSSNTINVSLISEIETYNYPVYLQIISQNRKNEQDLLELSLIYDKTKKSEFYLVPPSNQYQKTEILSDLFWDSTSLYISTRKNIKNIKIRISPLEMGTAIDKKLVFYRGERQFAFLFDAISRADVNLIRSIFSKENAKSGDVEFVGLNFVSTNISENIKTAFTLEATGTGNAQDLATIKYIQNLSLEYIAVLSSIITKTDYNNFSKLDFARFVDELDVEVHNAIKSIVLAEFLREQGFIARTMIGYKISDIQSKNEAKKNVWVEVLTQDNGWLVLGNGILVAHKGEVVALTVLEKYLELSYKGREPEIPSINF